MAIDLDETARALIYPNSVSSYLRAIRLFEFQICLFHPRALVSPKGTFIQRTARLLAAMKLLEYLETRTLAAGEKRTISWHDLSSDRDYVEIFEKVILRSGGWRAVRHIWSTKTFDDDLRARRAEARAAIKIVNFSYRFAMLRSDEKRKGGATMARAIICSSPSYNYTQGLSTLKTRWREYNTTAALLYLLTRRQKFELAPPYVGSADFSEKLLEQVADVRRLADFFGAYRHICEVLGTRGYRFPPINVEGKLSNPVLLVEPFPADLEEAIKKYPNL